MSHETSKAMKRRWKEDDAAIYPWRKWLSGRVLDVGCGPDPVPGAVGFDEKDGDANYLSRYFAPASFDAIHGSHVLEHMHSPAIALCDWLTLVKPGGYIIQTVPDVGAYERFTYPSKFNPDHKASFSTIYKGSAFPIHCHLPTFLASLSYVAEVLLCRYVEENYDWKKSLAIDQTWKAEDGVEIWCEFVLKKK